MSRESGLRMTAAASVPAVGDVGFGAQVRLARRVRQVGDQVERRGCRVRQLLHGEHAHKILHVAMRGCVRITGKIDLSKAAAHCRSDATDTQGFAPIGRRLGTCMGHPTSVSA